MGTFCNLMRNIVVYLMTILTAIVVRYSVCNVNIEQPSEEKSGFIAVDSSN